MTVYFSAQIRIKDPGIYDRYIEQAGQVFKQYNGRYLSVDNSPLLLEGEWDYTRSVLIRFDSETDFKQWYHSKAYQDILKFRLKGAVCDSILIKGLDETE